LQLLPAPVRKWSGVLCQPVSTESAGKLRGLAVRWLPVEWATSCVQMVVVVLGTCCNNIHPAVSGTRLLFSSLWSWHAVKLANVADVDE
jgi:hypothetical protein